VRGLLQQALARGGALGNGQFARPVQWFYTPMPAPAMLGAFGERGVVYDCMDELSQFKFAPPELLERERMLMRAADVVFTGGHKLWQSKSRLHPNVHFFGCGVDSAHFAKARLDSTPAPRRPPEQEAPILGFYGVIDERIDYALVAHLAEAFPDWTIAMAGPVVKVDPDALPKAPNIRWLGQKQYAELPQYAKAYDVCLMPFALNEATEYINPTKTLEYMAAGKPIVSTAVADVVRNFTPVVKVARSFDGFAAAVRSAVRAPRAGARRPRHRHGRRRVVGVDRREDALAHRRRARRQGGGDAGRGRGGRRCAPVGRGGRRRDRLGDRHRGADRVTAPATHDAAPPGEQKIVILGAGPTGLAAAYRLQELGHRNFRIYEARDKVGGLASSEVSPNGFTYDIGGHVLFSHYEYFDRLFDKLMGDEYQELVREAWVWMCGRFVPYPLQNNIKDLPEGGRARVRARARRGAEDAARPRRDRELRAAHHEAVRRRARQVLHDAVQLQGVGAPAAHDEQGVDRRARRAPVARARAGQRHPRPRRRGLGAQQHLQVPAPRRHRRAVRAHRPVHQGPPRAERAAASVDADAKTVTFADGRVESYDVLMTTLRWTSSRA
jgi:hypothetical protein